jgi:hypothetical protein
VLPAKRRTSSSGRLWRRQSQKSSGEEILGGRISVCPSCNFLSVHLMPWNCNTNVNLFFFFSLSQQCVSRVVQRYDPFRRRTRRGKIKDGMCLRKIGGVLFVTTRLCSFCSCCVLRFPFCLLNSLKSALPPRLHLHGFAAPLSSFWSLSFLPYIKRLFGHKTLP